MKLLILSDANSIHTQRWVFSLAEKGVTLCLFSLFKPSDQIAKLYDDLGIIIYTIDLKHKIKNLRNPNISKILYLNSIPKLKKIVKAFSPEIIHAHYASSYGVLAYLIHFRPTILSIWGSDIYDFPKRSFLNKWLLKKTLKSADTICSTSEAMRKIVKDNYNRNDCQLIPFGIDVNKFSPLTTNKEIFTVGTIKSIESHNGIDTIIDAAKILVHDKKLSNIQFLIVGDGSLSSRMKEKCKKLNLNNNIIFTGHISHDKIVSYYQKLSVFIAMSTRESFGVSILEAASCGIPAITSNVGGLPEVNINMLTGFVIKQNNGKTLSEKIMNLYNNEILRKEMGFKARQRVIEKFNWVKNVEQMLTVYNEYI